MTTTQTVPTINLSQLKLLLVLSRSPIAGGTEVSKDALALVRAGLAIVGRQSGLLTITEAGRQYIASAP